MTKQELKEIFGRVPTWPAERQEELARYALEIEAEMTGEYHASPDELQAIDEGLQGDPASPQEVDAVFGMFRRK